MGYTQDWFGLRADHWPAILNRLEDRTSRTFLEIGSFEGRSARWMLDNILREDDTLVCVDTFEGSVEHNREWCKANLLNTFKENIGDDLGKRCFYSPVPSFHYFVHNGISEEYRFDFIYVDGDHRSATVLADAILGFSRLKMGGIMIFDDYLWTGHPDNPKKGIDAFLQVFAPLLKQESIINGYQIVVTKTGEFPYVD